MNSPELIVSPPPHVHSGNRLQKIMIDFLIALAPAVIFGVYLFGLPAVKVLIIAVVSAVVWEALVQKLANKPLAIDDLTAVVSGLIFGLCLPPAAPWWMIVVGTLLMITLGKELYGGYGSNPLNGVLIAWVVLQMSFPDYMAQWLVPGQNPSTQLAPMEVLKDQGPGFISQHFSLGQLFLGLTAGYIGQASVLMLLIGGIYLLSRKVVNWRIPISFLTGVFVFSGIFWVFNPGAYADPLFHLLAGGTFMAAFFLATDLPSSPVTPEGMILFGLCAGILSVIIRIWGAWTFGAFYAVFILNLTTPFLDKLAPVVYGR